MPFSCGSATVEPIGTMLMLSTPAATTRSCVPDMTAWAAKCTACCEEPHWRSMVTPGTLSGRPADSQAFRRDVDGLRPDLGDASHDDVVHRGGIGAGPGDELGQDLRGQVYRVHRRQAAVPPADGGAHRPDDVCLRHDALR